MKRFYLQLSFNLIKSSMNWKYFFISILGLFFSLRLWAQEVLPMDGNTLNYRQILFEVPRVQNANSYLFYIQKCNERAESCKSIYTHKTKYRYALLTEPFEFGNTYKWFYEAKSGSKTIYTSKEFVLYLGSSELLDTNVQKLVYTKPNKKRDKGIMLVDGLKLAIDMQGKPVMYLNYKIDHAIRDINLTPQGTLTLVDNRLGEVKEMLLNGEMVWIGPTKHGDTEGRADKFHHEFEKLSSGNYLAAGKKAVADFDVSADLVGVPDNLICETMVEFDSERNEVWRFDLLPELKRQLNISPTAEVFNPSRLGHLNGMAVDESKQIIYASFKTFNTVMKIDKASKNIIYRYGLKKINFMDSLENGLAFEQQHAPVFNKAGNLLILNNGNPTTGSGITELLVANELNIENEVKKSIYFKNYLDKDYYAAQMGSVKETGKNKYLVCMGSLPHFFEINTRRKKVLWQAYTYQNTRWNEKAYQWKPLHSYRIHKYSSLYPFKSLVDLVQTKKGKYIEIINAGTETDTFLVSELAGTEEQSILLKKYSIKPGKAARFFIKSESNRTAFKIKSSSGYQIINP